MFKLFTLCFFAFFSSLGNPTFDSILLSIQNQQVEELSQHFNEEISLTLGKQKGFFTKSKAEQAIQQFFKLHPVQKAFIQSTGNKENDQFAIGKFTDKSGKTFRMYWMGKEKNHHFVLLELRFQE